MNELKIKQALQTFLAANTAYKWDTTDESFVNIFEGEVYGNDRIASNHVKQKLSIEFSLKIYSTSSLDNLDNTILTTKKTIELLLRSIKNRNDIDTPIKALKFENWEKNIETNAVSDKQIQYVAKLSMYYSLIVLGFDQVT